MIGWLIAYAVGALGWAFVATLWVFLHTPEEEWSDNSGTVLLVTPIWPFPLAMALAVMLAGKLKKQA